MKQMLSYNIEYLFDYWQNIKFFVTDHPTLES